MVSVDVKRHVYLLKGLSSTGSICRRDQIENQFDFVLFFYFGMTCRFYTEVRNDFFHPVSEKASAFKFKRAGIARGCLPVLPDH